MNQQSWVTGMASPEVIVNENFANLAHQVVYAQDPNTTTGLTWGYIGGTWYGFTVANGTLTLTASATNYVVVKRADGTVSSSTATTNWNDSTNYARAWSIVAGTSGITGTPADYRVSPGGVFLAAATQTAQQAQAALSDFSQNTSTTTGLTYGYNAGVMRGSGTTITSVSSGTVSLTASATNYVEVDASGTVSTNTTGFNNGRFPMAAVVTGASSITTVTDKRAFAHILLGTVNVYTKNQSVTPSALTSGATIAVDASLSNNFKLTLATNATLSNPTNATDGMVLNIRIKQDSTGSRTLAYGSAYKWAGGSAPALSTAANAVDLLSMYYDATNAVWACVLQKGFA